MAPLRRIQRTIMILYSRVSHSPGPVNHMSDTRSIHGPADPVSSQPMLAPVPSACTLAVLWSALHVMDPGVAHWHGCCMWCTWHLVLDSVRYDACSSYFRTCAVHSAPEHHMQHCPRWAGVGIVCVIHDPGPACGSSPGQFRCSTGAWITGLYGLVPACGLCLTLILYKN